MPNCRHFLGLFIVLIVTTISLPAQPILTSQQLPQAGDLVVQDWMNTVPLQYNTAGPNQIWDHSQTTFNSVEDSGRYVNMTSTFPGWNYNLGYKFIAPFQPKYEFYQLASTYLRYAGYARTDLSLDTLVLTSTSLLLPVPLAYGDTHLKSITGQYVNNGFPISLSGSSNLEADAYGTVILPWATYNNVLRVHVADTLYLFGQTQTNNAYYYYDLSERYPIMVIFENDIPQGYITRMGIPTAVPEATAELAPRIFPNPVKDRIFVETQSYTHKEMQLKLLDMRGQIVQEWKIGPGTGYETLVLQVEKVAAGLYMLQVNVDENRTYHRKVYIQQN